MAEIRSAEIRSARRAAAEKKCKNGPRGRRRPISLDLVIAASKTCSLRRPPGGIAAWQVVISGFTQDLERPNGCQQLWDSLRRQRADGQTPVLLEPWNYDWRGLAELIWRFRPAGPPPRVDVFAYSWGGGWGFPRLAAELQKRGLEIARAVLCDAVYRPRLRLLAGAALLPVWQIVVPENVREVSWYYQRSGFPMGHPVVAADPRRTRVNPGVLVRGVTHHYMDDQACWWSGCLEAAAAA